MKDFANTTPSHSTRITITYHSFDYYLISYHFLLLLQYYLLLLPTCSYLLLYGYYQLLFIQRAATRTGGSGRGAAVAVCAQFRLPGQPLTWILVWQQRAAEEDSRPGEGEEEEEPNREQDRGPQPGRTGPRDGNSVLLLAVGKAVTVTDRLPQKTARVPAATVCDRGIVAARGFATMPGPVESVLSRNLERSNH